MGPFPENFLTRRALEKVSEIFSGFRFQQVQDVVFFHLHQGLVALGAA
jgi:hypothetical protein